MMTHMHFTYLHPHMLLCTNKSSSTILLFTPKHKEVLIALIYEERPLIHSFECEANGILIDKVVLLNKRNTYMLLKLRSRSQIMCLHTS